LAARVHFFVSRFDIAIVMGSPARMRLETMSRRASQSAPSRQAIESGDRIGIARLPMTRYIPPTFCVGTLEVRSRTGA
jgi:hypothetical protein